MLVLKTAPTTEPVTIDELKAWAKIDGSAEDLICELALSAAREALEALLGRSFLSTTWYEYFSRFPWGDALILGRSPASAITAITYYDTAGTTYTFDAANYRLSSEEPARIVLAFGCTWPGTMLRTSDGVRVEYVAGYGTDRTKIPATLRQAILILAAHKYENRDAVIVGREQEILAGFGLWDQILPYCLAWGIA